MIEAFGGGMQGGDEFDFDFPVEPGNHEEPPFIDKARNHIGNMTPGSPVELVSLFPEDADPEHVISMSNDALGLLAQEGFVTRTDKGFQRTDKTYTPPEPKQG